MRLKVQSTLAEQPHHHSKRSTQVAGHGGVHGNAGTSWKVKSLTSPVVGCHSMVPEDRELDRQDHSSSVGSTRSGLVGITSSPARSSPRQETEVTLFIDVSKSGWGAQLGSFKLVPQALQKIYQSHGVQMILVAPKQETASWFPELLELSQQDLIPLYAEGQPPLTQDVILPDGETETGHQIYVRGDFAGHPKGKGTFTGSCRYDVKITTSVIAISLWNTLGKIRPFL